MRELNQNEINMIFGGFSELQATEIAVLTWGGFVGTLTTVGLIVASVPLELAIGSGLVLFLIAVIGN